MRILGRYIVSTDNHYYIIRGTAKQLFTSIIDFANMIVKILGEKEIWKNEEN